MIITCENCQTRFELDETRVPPEGVRVRCSRCQHRFRAKPPEAGLNPHEIASRTLEHTAPVPERPRISGARSPEDEGDLENPQFLFGGVESLDAGQAIDDEPASAALLGERPEAAPQPPADRLSSGHERAGAVDSPTGDVEPDSFSDLFDTSVLGREPVGAANLAGAAAAAEAAPANEPPFAAGAEVWDDPGGDIEAPGPVSAPAPGSTRAAFPAAPQLELDALPAAAIERAPFDAPEPVRDWFRPLRLVLAVAVSLVLALAAARALWTFGMGAEETPSEVHGAGWIASRIEAFHLYDGKGRRVLVVRGRLDSQGSAWLPQLRAWLVDANGARVGTAVTGEHVWLEREQLAPDALSRRLSEPPRPVHQAAGSNNRFTVLLLDPGGSARHYQLELGSPAP